MRPDGRACRPRRGRRGPGIGKRFVTVWFDGALIRVRSSAGTRYQRAAGIDDSPDLFAADVMRKNHGEADPRIVDSLCRSIGPTLEWLDDRHGVRFDVLQGFTYPGHSRLRMHAVAEKTGEALMAALLRAAADVDILTFVSRHRRFASIRSL
jgi:aspartate oxidase